MKAVIEYIKGVDPVQFVAPILFIAIETVTGRVRDFFGKKT